MEKLKGIRLKKYSRNRSENLPPRRITNRSIEIIDIIYRYWFMPTSGDVNDFTDEDKLASYFGIVPRGSNSNQTQQILSKKLNILLILGKS
jgi:hypothetical protein